MGAGLRHRERSRSNGLRLDRQRGAAVALLDSDSPDRRRNFRAMVFSRPVAG